MATEVVVEQPRGVSPRRRGRRRVVTLVLGWLLLAVAVAGLVVHRLDTGHQVLLVLAAVAWCLVPASLLAALVFVLGRHWYALLGAVAVVVVQVITYGPLFVAQSPPASGTTVRVMTENMQFGQADAQVIVDRVRSEDVDVLMLEELTPEAVDRLYAAGLKSVMPHGWWRSGAGASGTGLWSRSPFTDPQAERGFSMYAVSARLELPDDGGDVTLLAFHASAPWPQRPTGWRRDLANLDIALQQRFPAGPVIVGGDFNATWDHAAFRSLLHDGYHDAARQTGAGFVRTWPADRLTPVIGIDHVLVRGGVATTFDTYASDGSDHRGVIATVVVGR